MRRTRRPSALWALGLALPLLAVTGAAGAADDDLIWMRVEVDREGSEHGLVKINLPLSLVEVVVDSIDKQELMEELESEHPSLDITKMWREIRRMPTDEFLTVESDDEHIRVWKDRDFFRVSIREERSSDPVVQIKLPLDVMDYVFEKRNWTFQEMVERVRPHLPLTLVEVNKDAERVKIWLETR